jgi:hypothetical protein
VWLGMKIEKNWRKMVMSYLRHNSSICLERLRYKSKITRQLPHMNFYIYFTATPRIHVLNRKMDGKY